LVAFHEAGHAVIAIRLGAHLFCVSTVHRDVRDRDGNLIRQTAGRAAYIMPGTSSRDAIERRIAISLAGPAAEHLVKPDCADSGSDLDIAKALDRASEIVPPEQLPEFMGTMILRTLALVAANRNGIARVANALLAKRELSGREVAAILDIEKHTRPTATEKTR
jgi:ATP-dependent Zn protease